MSTDVAPACAPGAAIRVAGAGDSALLTAAGACCAPTDTQVAATVLIDLTLLNVCEHS